MSSRGLDAAHIRCDLLIGADDVEQPYRSGKNPGWIKVKSKTWRAANRDRWELFDNRADR